MQISKSNSEGVQFIVKIQKLKAEINNASQYLDLEKCSSKLAKIKEKSSAMADKKKRKQIKELIQVAQGLIYLKTKKFKKRIIDQIAKGNTQKQNIQKQKTLNYSKSMDNFDFSKLPPGKVKIKNEEEDSWQDRTEVQPRNNNLKLQKRVQQLEDQISNYKKKIAKIEDSKSSFGLTQLCYRLGQQQGLFEQQLGFKLRQKAMQIDQLKQKLRRSDEKNQQFKNRLMNEQKRQQDYIQNLKNHINSISIELQVSTKQNKKLQQQINKIYYVCDGYKLQVKKLMQEVEFLHRQKKKSQQNEILRMKDNSIKRQLQTIQLQDKYMREMESMIQTEKDQKTILIEKISQLEKRNTVLQEQNNQIAAQNQRYEEILEIKTQEIAEIKKELVSCLEHKNKCEDELCHSRSTIIKLQAEIASSKQKKSIQLQKKAEHLKQIKQLLQTK